MGNVYHPCIGVRSGVSVPYFQYTIVEKNSLLCIFEGLLDGDYVPARDGFRILVPGYVTGRGVNARYKTEEIRINYAEIPIRELGPLVLDQLHKACPTADSMVELIGSFSSGKEYCGVFNGGQKPSIKLTEEFQQLARNLYEGKDLIQVLSWDSKWGSQAHFRFTDGRIAPFYDYLIPQYGARLYMKLDDGTIIIETGRNIIHDKVIAEQRMIFKLSEDKIGSETQKPRAVLSKSNLIRGSDRPTYYRPDNLKYFWETIFSETRRFGYDPWSVSDCINGQLLAVKN